MNREELAWALRCCAKHERRCLECEFLRNGYCSLQLDAAAAIEELDAEETRLLLLTSDLQDKVMELQEQLNDAEIAADDNGRQVEALQAAQPHWVSVEEPPKERDFYFAFTADGEAKVCDYIPSVDQWWDGDDMILSVTHWMPVEPPKEDA